MQIKNELGVIVAFAQLTEQEGFPWRIISIDGFFPDAEIQHRTIGDTLSVEFEHKASSFVKHGHNLEGCDVIICWENDWPNCPINVWALRDGRDVFVLRPTSKWAISQHQKELELGQLRKRISKLEHLIQTGRIVVDDMAIVLTWSEHRLMALFLEHEGDVCDREQISRAVWDREYDSADDTVIEKLMSRLRSKLTDVSYPSTIQTVRGRGYMLTQESQ